MFAPYWELGDVLRVKRGWASATDKSLNNVRVMYLGSSKNHNHYVLVIKTRGETLTERGWSEQWEVTRKFNPDAFEIDPEWK